MIMKFINLSKIILILAGLLLLHSTIAMASDQQSVGDAEVTFQVAWYDVGKDALEGLNGIKKVDKGIQRSKLWFKEINTVVYDPEVITIEEMKSALEKAGTYKGIVTPEK